MKAILINNPGGIETLNYTDVSKPVAGANQIVIKNAAIGINFIDIYLREGIYKPEAYPFIPGKEVSGIVDSVGAKVSRFKVGDRVATCTANGAYAEYTAVDADQTVAIPEGVSFENAAAIMLQGMTAYYLSHLTFPLNNTHAALIHAGAGGVGLLLIQMAKLCGAKVITTVSKTEKVAWAKEAGADEVIVTSLQDWLPEVKKITQQKGVDVVYDAIGKDTFDMSLEALKVRGMMVSYGQASGKIPPFEPLKLSKSVYLTRPSLFDYIETRTELENLSEQVFNYVREQKLKVHIGQNFVLADAAKAQSALQSRTTTGKVLLSPK